MIKAISYQVKCDECNCPIGPVHSSEMEAMNWIFDNSELQRCHWTIGKILCHACVDKRIEKLRSIYASSGVSAEVPFRLVDWNTGEVVHEDPASVVSEAAQQQIDEADYGHLIPSSIVVDSTGRRYR